MESTSYNANVIDINATVEKHMDIAPNLLAAHGLSGCDTGGKIFGIGKQTVVKILKSKCVSFESIGELSGVFSDCVREGTEFLLYCYGQTKDETLTDARKRIWKNRIANSNNTAPKLESLPPTDPAFKENLKCAYLQVAIWRHALNVNPPDVVIEEYGWFKDPSSSCLLPS